MKNRQAATKEERALESKYELLRKKKELRKAKRLVKEAEENFEANENEEQKKKKKKKRERDDDDDDLEDGDLDDVKKKRSEIEIPEIDVRECAASVRTIECETGLRNREAQTTRTMKRPGHAQKNAVEEKDNGCGDGNVEDDETKEVRDEDDVHRLPDETKPVVAAVSEEVVVVVVEKEKRGEEESNRPVAVEEKPAAALGGGIMKIKMKKSSISSNKKKSADANSNKGNLNSTATEGAKEDDAVARAIAKAKAVMQKENEKRDKEIEEEKKKQLKREENEKKALEANAAAVPKIVVPKFGKKRELDPEWLKTENDRYEREQKEREEKERVAKEEALKPKKRQKRPNLAPKNAPPLASILIKTKNTVVAGSLDGETDFMDTEAGQMGELDDETARALGIRNVREKEAELERKNEEDNDEEKEVFGREVFVGGIPAEATETDVADAFNRFGKVREVRLFDSQTYGFVKFYNPKSAELAIKPYEGRDGASTVAVDDPVMILNAPVTIVEYAASGKELVRQKAFEIAQKLKENGEEIEAAIKPALNREVMQYEQI